MPELDEKNSNENIKLLIENYSGMLFRICYCILCNPDDAEDALQDTFLKYLTKAPEFESSEHEKAWLIKVATNISKNMVLLRKRRKTVDLDELNSIGIEDEDSQVFEAIMSLPVKYKIVMTLFYIEGYDSKEVSKIIGVSPEAVRKRMQKGRELLKNEIEKWGDGYDK